MRPGFQFEEIVDDVKFRVFYSRHFVSRYEVGEPTQGRSPVKNTVAADIIRSNIVEALDELSGIVYGDKDAEGVIVSRGARFIMVFAVIEREDGFQVTMVTTSPSLNFTARSPKDYTIKVNPTYEIIFSAPLSYALKVAIMADLAPNAEVLEDGGTFHLGGELMDYWVERTGNAFHVVMADWAKPLYEIQVS